MSQQPDKPQKCWFGRPSTAVETAIDVAAVAAFDAMRSMRRDAPRPHHRPSRMRETTKATRACLPTLRVRPQFPRRGDGFSLHRPYNDKSETYVTNKIRPLKLRKSVAYF